MPDDPRVLQLVEEALDSGRTPQEVCSDFPELLVDVLLRVKECRSVEAQLDDLFPPSEDSRAIGRRRTTPGNGLPPIPGYEVQAVLGHGGMGVVYKAKQLRLNRVVAIKMLLSGVYASPLELTRFTREAEAVAGLRHAHVVQVYDIGDLDGRPYFTMEWLEGGHLGQKLLGNPQPARQAAELTATLAAAVDAAHRAGIVHRDLKPANVLLTADGVAKVTDFGLARLVDGDQGLTLSGARIGTPSYMAPEQALGKAAAIGPATDVYALGAILYEMLTGRPPFRGETAVETERQLLAEDPVAPSRLNAKVPRDLETICLKCLRKTPEKRYATAAELADDCRRFLNGEPIAARVVGRIERASRWVRRHPALATGICGAILLCGLLILGGFWIALEGIERRHIVETDLREVVQLQDRARWGAAQAALERARAGVGRGGLVDLRAQIARAAGDLDLVMKLDAVRLIRVTQGAPAIYQAQACRNYENAFRAAALLDATAGPTAQVASRVRDSAVHLALVAAIDDWIVCTTDANQRGWLIDVARQADPDPNGWRGKVLDQAKWADVASITALCRDVPIEGQSLSLLLALGERLRAAGGDPASFLKRVQHEHAEDFWANVAVGNALLFKSSIEAEGYYRAALAARPEAAVSYCVVGDGLRLQSDYDAAADYYRKAIHLDPTYARAYTNLGLTLQNQGHIDQALDHFRKAIPLDPNYGWTYYELANLLRDRGDADGAAENYRHAVALDPSMFQAYDRLCGLLIRAGRGEEACDGWRKMLDAEPRDLDAWIGYAQLCLFFGRRDEYERARREMLDRFSDRRDPAVGERLSRACLLMPVGGEDLRRAVALADLAVDAKAWTDPWAYQYYMTAKGLADYREGHFQKAIDDIEKGAAGIPGPGPQLIEAMVRFKLGDQRAARSLLAAGVLSFDWAMSNADKRDHWVWHALRREAEAMILPNLRALVDGTDQPRDNDERNCLLGACEFEARNATAARIFAAAFEADPALAQESVLNNRYNAARCAALAAAGVGTDAKKLSNAEREALRRQALGWLRDSFAARMKALNPKDAASRKGLAQRLKHWLADKDLSGLRHLPESDPCAALAAALWGDISSELSLLKTGEMSGK